MHLTKRRSCSLGPAGLWRITLLGITLLFANGCGDDARPQKTDSNWPMLGYDLRSSFFNAVETRISPTSVGKLTEAWDISVLGSVNGTAAVVGDRVFALATGGLYALDVRTGESLWMNPDVGGTSSPSYRDGRLYVNDAIAVLRALDADDGSAIWESVIDDHPEATGWSSPVLVEDMVIVGSSSSEEWVSSDATFRGGVVAFDVASGAERWRYYTAMPPHNGATVWSSVSADPAARLLVATSGNNYTGEAGPHSDSIFALDLDTGRLIWNTQVRENDLHTGLNPQGPDYGFGTNPILFEAVVDGEKRQLVGAGEKSGIFWVVDRHTGAHVWSRAVSEGSYIVGGILNNGAYDGTRIIVAGNNGTSDGPGSEPASGESWWPAVEPTSVLMALDPGNGNVLWERQLPSWVWAPITIANGVGFVAAETSIQAFDVETGEKRFSMQTEGTITSGAAISHGRVFFGSGLAHVGVGAPDDGFHALAVPDD